VWYPYVGYEEDIGVSDTGRSRRASQARHLVERYRDLRLGLSDASLAILAYRYQTRRILTFDERAFRQVTPLQGGSFLILPADAQ